MRQLSTPSGVTSIALGLLFALALSLAAPAYGSASRSAEESAEMQRLPEPRCDAATTIEQGRLCECRPGMIRRDARSCACPPNTTLSNVGGEWQCLRTVATPQCNPETHMMLGGRCRPIIDSTMGPPRTPGITASVDTSSTPSCAPPPPAMQFWLSFDGNYSDLIANLSGAPSSGVSLIGDVPDGHKAYAGRLSPSGRIDFAASTAFGLGVGDFTLDAWVRTTEVNSLAVPVIDTRVGSGIGAFLTDSPIRGVFMFIFQGRLGFQMADGGYTNYVSDSFVATGEWHHVAIAVRRNDPQGGHMFVDGQLVYIFNPTNRAGSLGTSNQMTLGFDRGFNRHVGAIDIDEVEIFHRALAANEIFPLSQIPKCRPGTYQPALP